MKIRDLLKQTGPSISFEFFPPKDEAGFLKLYETIALLKRLHPTFVSVTYGAGGSTRSKTVELVTQFKQELQLESMPHLTCVGSSQQELKQVLDELAANGIDNVLALRGDPPQGETTFVPVPGGFRYANEIVAFIRDRYEFSIGVAGYPETHIECPDPRLDLEHLKWKVDAGADFVITQLFYDNRFYFDFVERAQKIGIQVPIIAGIMPILSVPQIKRFTKLCGATLPPALLKEIEAVQEDPVAVEQRGIEHATTQCEELLKGGAPGIHVYTLNRATAPTTILHHLRGEPETDRGDATL